MKSVILSTLRRKLGISKDTPYQIVYDYKDKKLSVFVENTQLEVDSALASLLENIKTQTIKALTDCKEPHKLILNCSKQQEELTIYYLDSEGMKLRKNLIL
jgi:hypothetical protein